MTALTWRGQTADYTEAERTLMRQLAADHPGEAEILHSLKAELGATIIDTRPLGVYAGAEGRWDERRNTSLVRQTYRFEDYQRAAEPVVAAKPVPDQLRMDEAA